MTRGIDFSHLSLCDAVDLAILVEEEAKDRYEELADQMLTHRNADVERFFLRMVQVELTHERILLSRRRALFRDEPRRVTRAMIFDGEAPDYREARATMTVREALEMALAGERKAFAFFDTALARVEDPQIRSFFTELRSEELDHQELVKAQLARLELDSALPAEDVPRIPVAHRGRR